jgi:hypothetical protein
MSSLDRRRFLGRATAALGAAAATASFGFDPLDEIAAFEPPPGQAPDDLVQGTREYTGPNVILIRFGGGVRPLETIEQPHQTYCPFIYHELAMNQGILFPRVEITPAAGIATSHGEGTLYILTGQYRHYEDFEHRFLADRFAPEAPTLFEYFRSTYNVPAHQALLINGEDRINEEFYSYSNHHQYGVRYKCAVLSLFRYKMFLLRDELAHGNLTDVERRQKEYQLRVMEDKDYRTQNRNAAAVSSRELDAFWESWRSYYGTGGLVNPRGDRLLTTLALRALRELRPRFMMINYQDPDYVHWGNPSFYTRAISIIDEGVREIYNAVQADEEQYRDRTVFVIIPDCGRDNNRCMAVPFQHHFNTASAHRIFAVVAEPRNSGQRQWITETGRICDRRQEQIGVTRAIGEIMGFTAAHAEAESFFSH